MDAKRDPKLSKTFSYKQVGSLLKVARLYKRNVSGRVTLLSGTQRMPVSLNKRQENEEAFFQKNS